MSVNAGFVASDMNLVYGWAVRDLETRQLRLLAAIADTGSLTAAAAGLGLTQPALSHALRGVEQQLGTPLFVRARRGMTLTEAGEQLLRTARQVLRELDAAQEAIARGAIGRGELVRLSTECYTAYHWLPAVLHDFRAACPQVELRVVPAAVGRPVQALRAGEIDVAIIARRDRDEGFAYHRLFDDELVAVLPPDHPRAGQPHLVAADFADEHLLLYTANPRDSTVVRELLGPAGVEPAQVSYVPATEALLELVKAGVGVSVFARWAVAPQVQQGALAVVPLGPRGIHRTWSAAVRPGAVQPQALGSLVALLQRHAPDFQSPRRALPSN
jgi:LysR family transcriptional regulator, regulator for metE and metH